MDEQSGACRSNAASLELVCPMCGLSSLTDRHCKRLCLRCGYVESCEDNFLPTQMNPVVLADRTAQLRRRSWN